LTLSTIHASCYRQARKISRQKNKRNNKTTRQQDTKTTTRTEGRDRERGKREKEKKKWINGPIKNFRKKNRREDDAT
jgi:hypothetical protein